MHTILLSLDGYFKRRQAGPARGPVPIAVAGMSWPWSIAQSPGGAFMPSVDVAITIAAPLDTVWKTVNDITSYPTFMDNVSSVVLVSEEDDGYRISEWSAILKGSVLEWTERERVEHDDHRIVFEQIDGDLEKFSGHWELEELEAGLVAARLSVEFEIGIPLLADMLNPVAARALKDNSEQMLREIEHKVALGRE